MQQVLWQFPEWELSDELSNGTVFGMTPMLPLVLMLYYVKISHMATLPSIE